MADYTPTIRKILSENGCRLERQGKEITKSGTALSRNSASPWMEKSGLAIPQTAYSNKRVCRNSFNDPPQNAKFQDLTPKVADLWYSRNVNIAAI
jgi:hypothetical protein